MVVARARAAAARRACRRRRRLRDQIQEIAETEALLTAVDHLDQFSDVELVSLIGF